MSKDNYVRITGEVKRDSEAVEVRNGVRVMNITLMVHDFINDMTVYVDCFAATEIADRMDGYVMKGETLTIEGSLIFRTVTDHNGRRKSGLMVYITDVEYGKE